MLTAAREECPHGSPAGCHECDMRLAEPLAGGPRADPELWRPRWCRPGHVAAGPAPGLRFQ